MRYLLLLVLSVNFMFSQSKEVREFEIKHKGKFLGTVTATKELRSDGITVYTTKALVNKTVLTIRKVDYSLVVEMKDGKLFKSDYKLYVNGKLKQDSQLHTENGQLIRASKGKTLEPISSPIEFVSSMFLFQSPEGHQKTFSESKQKFRTIYSYSAEPNKFGLGKNAKKLDTEYTYSNNILSHVYIDEFVDFTMEPKN